MPTSLSHAIMDALLGVAGLGDIGVLFPDSDERYRDADSLALLREVVAMIGTAGTQPVNVDTVVLMERPKLGPHREEIRRSLAGALGLPHARVNVKASTGEGWGSSAAARAWRRWRWPRSAGRQVEPSLRCCVAPAGVRRPREGPGGVRRPRANASCAGRERAPSLH